MMGALFRGPDGKVVEADNPTAQAYYEREPEFEPVESDAQLVEVEDTGDLLVRPADSDLKAEWVAYALQVDPDNEAEINAATKDELIAQYGGE